jgi:plasmid stability protein
MVNYSLRLPDELHAKIKSAAKRHRRSIHAEVIWRLERSLEEEVKAGFE